MKNAIVAKKEENHEAHKQFGCSEHTGKSSFDKNLLFIT